METCSTSYVIKELQSTTMRYYYILNCMLSCSVISVSLGPHGLQTTRLCCPWNFPGKSTRAALGVCRNRQGRVSTEQGEAANWPTKVPIPGPRVGGLAGAVLLCSVSPPGPRMSRNVTCVSPPAQAILSPARGRHHSVCPACPSPSPAELTQRFYSRAMGTDAL